MRTSHCRVPRQTAFEADEDTPKPEVPHSSALIGDNARQHGTIRENEVEIATWPGLVSSTVTILLSTMTARHRMEVSIMQVSHEPTNETNHPDLFVGPHHDDAWRALVAKRLLEILDHVGWLCCDEPVSIVVEIRRRADDEMLVCAIAVTASAVERTLGAVWGTFHSDAPDAELRITSSEPEEFSSIPDAVRAMSRTL